MEKIMEESDIKGLEEEIDSAVDRLFVDKKSSQDERLSMVSPIEISSGKSEKQFNKESFLSSSSEAPSLSKSFELMETQLLLLEWEISKENLGKTKKEILVFSEVTKGRPDITSVLNLMEKVLNRMIKNEENIQPSQIKFLLDAKETIKLLMKEKTGIEVDIYKQLAFGGIEARFLCLEKVKTNKIIEPLFVTEERIDKTEKMILWENKIDAMTEKMSFFIERMEGIFKKHDQYLLGLAQTNRTITEDFLKKNSLPMEIIVVKFDEKIFGIESQKVFKLFNVPNSLLERYSTKQKIRLKDWEIKMVDLRKIFPVESKKQKEEMQLLVVKENEEYKGLMVDRVLKRSSVQMNVDGKYEKDFLGVANWIYREKPMEIPVIDLRMV